jgi:hypothetical protein
MLFPRTGFIFAMLPFQNLSQPPANQPTGTEVGERAGNQNVKGTSTKMIEFVLHHQKLKRSFFFSTPQLDRMSKHYYRSINCKTGLISFLQSGHAGSAGTPEGKQDVSHNTS